MDKSNICIKTKQNKTKTTIQSLQNRELDSKKPTTDDMCIRAIYV